MDEALLLKMREGGGGGPHSSPQNKNTMMMAGDIVEVATSPAPSCTLTKPASLSSCWKRFLLRHPSFLCMLVQGAGELLGSFLLLFFVCGVSMGDSISHGKMTLMDHAVAAAFCIMFIIFSIGHISGAHVNPAVTLAFASIGKFPWVQVPCYVVAQLMGAIMGTLLAKMLYGVDVEIILSLPMPNHVGVAFAMELVISITFMFLACTVSNTGQVVGLQAALAIAAFVALSIIIAGPISGASMNPIRSLAPAIVANKYEHVWVYMVAPPLGSVLGAWTQKIFFNIFFTFKESYATPNP